MTILSKINSFSEKLQQASKWHNSNALIAIVTTTNEVGAKPDYIYEFFCLTSIIEDLSYNYSISFIKGKGKWEYGFPKNPAKKEGKPYFVALDKITSQEKFQVCAGTKVKTPYNDKSRAPDISFQISSSPSSPDYNHLLFILDAKYNYPTSGKNSLGISEFSYVTQMIRDLCLDNPQNNVKIIFNRFKGFDANCIITNGEGYSRDHQYHFENHIKVIEYFDKDYNYKIIG